VFCTQEKKMNCTTKWLSRTALALMAGALFIASVFADELTNGSLSVSIGDKAQTYKLITTEEQLVFESRVAAEIDQQWVKSTDYPKCQSAESSFGDALGAGREITVACSGLEGKPDLVYVVQMYNQAAYGTIQVKVRNNTKSAISIQSIRSLEAIGQSLVDLGGAPSADRVLSDSSSEDRPDMKIYDLGSIFRGMHRGVGSQLIYNRESKRSLFLGALTSDRFFTVMHLQAEGEGAGTKISSYTVDSTGTTECMKDYELQGSSLDNQVELSLRVEPGQELASERLLFVGGPDYHKQLLQYGDAIRRLHNARVDSETPIGWWSWTAYYGGITEGDSLSNADWLAQHLKSLGYKYFQIDEGYQYARGEYETANATQFPDGMRFVGHHITRDGLVFGVWTAPFEVTSRAWVYGHHKDWLVHNAKGEPIPLGNVWNQNTDVLYALDTTNPEAQEYLRRTYKTLVREWGVRFIKLDFMDSTAVEGYRYRPNTTALEAQRIGLEIIRNAVGDEVILDKDGSPMLNPVGLVDTGRISVDTGHSFARTRNAATGIAARFYMHRNFFLSDPDAFNVTQSYLLEGDNPQPPVTLSAAQASMALSAMSGGMYEIGDDLMLLGSEKDRLSLVENQDLLNLPKIGRASTPVDLMSYDPADEQPSIFFLRESPRQSILTVFNWTKTPRSHVLKLADFGLPADHAFVATNVLSPGEAVPLKNGEVQIDNQLPESVKVIKIVDSDVSKAAPKLEAQVPATAQAGQAFMALVKVDADGVPAISYHWDFGDGITGEGRRASHTYTRAGEFTIHLAAESVDGIPSEQKFSVTVTGALQVHPNLSKNRRFVEPTDH
jgi:alpha-galactosidase